MNSRRISTNSEMKVKRLQKKRGRSNKEDSTRYERGVLKSMESLRKNNQMKILEMKCSLSEIKDTVESSRLEQVERHNFRA
jgi:hypothetical protein